MRKYDGVLVTQAEPHESHESLLRLLAASRSKRVRVKEEPSLRRVAFHEAGHAVVAWRHGLTVEEISIRREGDSLGRTRHTPVGDPEILEELRRENFVALAGAAAEQMADPTDDADPYDGGDLSCVWSRLHEYITEERRTVEFGWAEQNAERIVSENAPRLDRLAELLLVRHELSDPEEIRMTIEQGRNLVTPPTSTGFPAVRSRSKKRMVV